MPFLCFRCCCCLSLQAEAARERKDEVKKAKKSAAEKAAEDAKWVDEGSTATEQRKREKAARDAEEARKRAEKRALQLKEEEEAAAISGKAKGLSNAEKMTRAMLLRQAEEAEERRKEEAERQRLAAMNIVAPEEPSPNLNRALNEEKARDVEQFGAENVIYASGVDAALSATAGKVLTTGTAAAAASSSASSSSGPKPPTMKSAFAEFEVGATASGGDTRGGRRAGERRERCDCGGNTHGGRRARGRGEHHGCVEWFVSSPMSSLSLPCSAVSASPAEGSHDANGYGRQSPSQAVTAQGDYLQALAEGAMIPHCYSPSALTAHCHPPR